MKTKAISILLLGLFYINISLAQTHHDKYIHVADTNINLANVDLEKGLVIQKKRFIKNTGAKRPINYYTKIKVFSSPNLNSYVLILDTLSWSEGSWDRDKQTVLQYFNENHELVFEKKFNVFYVSECYISASNEIIVTSKTNEDYEGYDFYKSDGTLIKKYSTDEELYVGPMHRNFCIRTSDEKSKSNIYDHIDESGNINEMILPQGFLRGIKFSPQENYYLVSLDDQQLLYDKNNVLIWSKPKNEGFIYFLKDEKSYLLSEPLTNYIKIKDLLTHQLKCEIDSVSYKGDRVPIGTSFSLNGDFWVIGKKDSLYIYNFYNESGELLQTEAVPVTRSVKPYTVIKKDGKFILKPNK